MAVSQFFAAGMPKSKGSARAFVTPRTNRAIITHSDKNTKTWQGVVSSAAIEAGITPIDGAVLVSMVFLLPRPKGHYGTGKNAGALKEWAKGLRPSAKPDVDKLSRTVLDALTGLLYADDARVTCLVAKKRWVGWGLHSTAGVFVEAGVDEEV